MVKALMYQSIPSTNIPPGDPRGFALYCCPEAGIILDDLPRGPGFCISIKLRLVQLKSILSLNWHLDHTSMRFIGSSDLAKAFQDTRHKLLTAKEQCGMKISYLKKINRACLYSYLIRYQIIRHVVFKPFVHQTTTYIEYVIRHCHKIPPCKRI